MTRVAFFGLGTMGGGMAERLIHGGFPVTVWNRDAERTRHFRDLGAAVAPSPREAVENADVAISMVADDAASRTVWLGELGALAGMRAGSVAVESSTISPALVRELADAAAARGSAVIDAPVTGSKAQAASGELRFLVGGDPAVLDTVRPVLTAMSKEIVHLGPVGSGALLKLVNNFLCGVQAVSVAEAVALIERSGLDQEVAWSVLRNGAPTSPVVTAASKRMTGNDYAVNFKLALMRKDLAYAIDEGDRYGVSLDTAKAARASFDQAIPEWGDADFSAVVETLRKKKTTT